MKNIIPEGLVLETDPKIIKLFSPRFNGVRPPTEEELSAYQAYSAKMRARSDERLKEYELEHPPQPVCKLGRSKVSRIISRYIYWYKQKPSDNRTFIINQLTDLAKEHHIALPSPEQLNKHKPKKRLVAECVDETRPDFSKPYRAYYDGENIVAYLPGENKCTTREVMERTKWDDLFEIEYRLAKLAIEEMKEPGEQRTHIEAELVKRFYDVYGYNDSVEAEPCPIFIARKLYNKSAAYAERRKRFFRKKDQVRWTAWWTITYDDKKFVNEEEFALRLKNKFRNLCNNNHWLILGVFERGEENGRLHFHGFFYIPAGESVGVLVDEQHWSEKEHRLVRFKSNTEFSKKFGKNVYEDITEATQHDVSAMAKYTAKMLHYMDKGGDVYYSRHIPIDFALDLHAHDLLVDFTIVCKRNVKRYVVADFLIKRSEVGIVRMQDPVVYKKTDPYDNGLLDIAA